MFFTEFYPSTIQTHTTLYILISCYCTIMSIHVSYIERLIISVKYYVKRERNLSYHSLCDIVGFVAILNLNNVYITTGACVCVLCLAVLLSMDSLPLPLALF